MSHRNKESFDFEICVSEIICQFCDLKFCRLFKARRRHVGVPAGGTLRSAGSLLCERGKGVSVECSVLSVGSLLQRPMASFTRPYSRSHAGGQSDRGGLIPPASPAGSERGFSGRKSRQGHRRMEVV